MPRKKSKNNKVVLAARVSEAEFDAVKGPGRAASGDDDRTAENMAADAR